MEVEFLGGIKVRVKLRHPPTQTVKVLETKLPFRSAAHRWGDEVYFEVPFHSVLEKDSRQEMEVGDVAFWPGGDAVAIFFGPTPVSDSHLPKAYSPCNVIGKVDGDVSILKPVREGTTLVARLL